MGVSFFHFDVTAQTTIRAESDFFVMLGKLALAHAHRQSFNCACLIFLVAWPNPSVYYAHQ